MTLGAVLAAELARPASWSGALPPDDGSAVTLRDTPAESDVMMIHPQGRLEVRQTLCPLGEKLDKYGERALAHSSEFVIAAVRIEDATVEHTAVRDRFAPTQYEEVVVGQHPRLTAEERRAAAAARRCAGQGPPARRGAAGGFRGRVAAQPAPRRLASPLSSM